MKACGLTSLPDRRTFDRRLSTISVDIKERIATMASLFVKEKLVDPYIIAIDSTLLRAKGHLWHKPFHQRFLIIYGSFLRSIFCQLLDLQALIACFHP